LIAGGELDIASPAGYLNSQVFALLAPLILLIFAIGAGAGAVAGEEEKGTLDFVLAHPVRRSRLVLQRSLALVALVGTLTIVLFVTVASVSLLVDLEIGVGRLIAASVSAGLLAALFGMVALAGGSLRSGRTQAIALAVGLVVASWLLDGFGQSVDVLEPLRPLSPYYQAMGRNPLREGIAVGSWVLLMAITSLLVTVAALGLQRRDLRQ
jgi:ABC-2 type transport system permease protein